MSGAAIIGQIASDVGNNIFGAMRDQEARDWQYRMWQAQNEYNLPVNQVQRLKDAGINPNIAFGHGGATAIGTSVPSSPTVHMSPMHNPVTAALEAQNIKANIRYQDAQSRREELNNDLLETVLEDRKWSMLAGYRSDWLRHQWFAEHGVEKMDAELRAEQFLGDVREAQKELTVANTNLTWRNYELAKQRFDALAHKYNWEAMYYAIGQNPYETSTPMGFVRATYGVGQSLFQSMLMELRRLREKLKNNSK